MKKVEKGFMSFAEGFTNKPVRTDFRQVDWNKC